MTGVRGLSVVVLTYNSGATIGQCLESLVQQHNKEFDVIVVDDDSTDETLAIAKEYSSALSLTIVQSGARSIPSARNLGLRESVEPIVAFVDSDDSATPEWTQVIANFFEKNPGVAAISGASVPSYRSRTAEAIALNDDAIRKLAGRRGTFAAGNCAINRTVFPDARFDEDFRFGEDLEMMVRVAAQGEGWVYLPEMRINYFSRATLRQYASQMRNYGFMKIYVAYYAKSYRLIDFAPLAVVLGGAVASLVTLTWWPVLLIVPFSLLESLGVLALQRCKPAVAMLSFPAWLVKNLAWSWGVVCAGASLASSAQTRQLLKSKRAAN
jgi:glycosyltransferase involved in cell wall biosynthesis